MYSFSVPESEARILLQFLNFIWWVCVSVCVCMTYNMQYSYLPSFNIEIIILQKWNKMQLIQVERLIWQGRDPSVGVGSYQLIIIVEDQLWDVTKEVSNSSLPLDCTWSSWRVKFNTQLNQCSAKFYRIESDCRKSEEADIKVD